MAEVIIDQDVRHGKPIIKGTRITVDDVLGMLESGMSRKEIKEEYRLSDEDIRAVIRYVAGMIKGDEFRTLTASKAKS